MEGVEVEGKGEYKDIIRIGIEGWLGRVNGWREGMMYGSRRELKRT